MKETDIQAVMVADAKLQGAFAFKMSNRFLIGVPDLFIQFDKLPTAIIEVKYERKMPRSGIVKCDLTAHQMRHINGINKRGGLSGWACAVKMNTGEFEIMVGRNTGKADVGGLFGDTTDNQCFWLQKRRGELWPMRDMVSVLQKLQR